MEKATYIIAVASLSGIDFGVFQRVSYAKKDTRHQTPCLPTHQFIATFLRFYCNFVTLTLEKMRACEKLTRMRQIFMHMRENEACTKKACETQCKNTGTMEHSKGQMNTW